MTIAMAAVIDQPDQRVCQGEAQCDPGRADNHGEGGEAVGACVDAVGDQGCGSDGASYSDAVDRDELVPDEPDEAGNRDPTEMLDRGGVHQPADPLPAGEHR